MRCRNCTPIPEEVRAVADLLERRATVSILLAAHEGALRFNEFLQVIGRVPPATLASRLSDLEQAGVLEREVLDTRPPARHAHRRAAAVRSERVAPRLGPTPARRRPLGSQPGRLTLRRPESAP